MSGYQRMVSYLYRYEKGIKGKNVGFARIELRNEKMRVTVRFQDMLQISPRISFFIQKEDGLFQVPVGNLMRNGNTFTGKVETSQANVAGSEYSFEQLDGIYITGPENVFYATTWKDIVISEQGAGVNAENARENVSEETAAAVPEQVRAEPADTRDLPEQPETLPKQPETGSGSAGAVLKQPENTPELESAALKQPDNNTRAREFCEKMLRIFPKMYPFETAGVGECVRIDLKDIGNLPVACWSLAGNPFLLQGYYCYRHLIFTRMDGGYAVGVPGIYSEDNGRWAQECRMTKFQPLSPVKDRHGAFGYWLYRIPQK